jgi:hypothetical protein
MTAPSWEVVDVQDYAVKALEALDVERTNAVLPHVREVHRLDLVLEPLGHGLHHSASRARIMAGLFGFFTLIQSRDRPDR